MPSTCNFQLNKVTPVYFSGEIVAGTVTLNTTKEKNVRNISLGLLGEAKVKWEETYTITDSYGNNIDHTKYYCNHRIFINHVIHVMGEGVLPVGKHTYSFNMLLPQRSPTSCEAQFGYLRYELFLILNRRLSFDNVYKLPITVIQIVDLNLYPTYKYPAVIEEMSSLCCWPCNKGKLLTTLSVPFGAYAPGQNIKYSIRIHNQSMADVQSYTVEFRQMYVFIAATPTRKENIAKYVLLQQKISKRCLRLTNRIFEGTLQIPSIVPTTLMEDDPIIRVTYSLKVYLQMSGCHRSVHLKVPIFIGTVPLRESLMTDQPEPVAATAPELPQLDCNIVGDSPPQYSDLKPPSFEEAIRSEPTFVDTDIDEHNRIVGFRPLYPMYQENKDTIPDIKK